MNKNLAFVFPGQGSQSIGMSDELISEFPEAKQYFVDAGEVLGYDLLELVQNGPEEKLNTTENTQPAMLVSAYACYQAWLKNGGEEASLLAGHSLGEYTALVAAGSIDFLDAVKLVNLRGQYMTEAVSDIEGAMAAIVGLDDGRIEEICNEVCNDKNDAVVPANYNSIGQVVIAGEGKYVQKAIELANSAGARLAKTLPVSVPCHCPLMNPASSKLRETLDSISIKTPKIPVLNNVDVLFYNDAESIREGLVRQLYSPVRWVESILKMQEKEITKIIEMGPGNVLTGLIRRIDRNLKPQSISNLSTIKLALN